MADVPQAINDLKRDLLAAMRASGVVTVRVEYSGSGDDGCIDCIVLEPKAAQGDAGKAVTELAERLTEALIEHYHDGYENNDGGAGVVTAGAEAGTIEYERTDYYTDSTTESMQV